MKKTFIFSACLILFFGFSFENNNLKNINKLKFKDLDQNSIILDYKIGDHSSGIIVDSDGDYLGDSLYLWGRNNSGQIGNGNIEDSVSSPTLILPSNDLWGGDLIQFEESPNSSGVSVDTDQDGYADTLYFWGDNNHYQISSSQDKNVLTPTIILPSSGDWGGNIIDFAISNTSVYVLIDTDLDGYGDTLYAWGSNNAGQLGDGTTKDSSEPLEIFPSNQSNWGGNIIDIYAGDSDYPAIFLSLDTDLNETIDTLYGWGYNSNSKLGIGSSVSFINVPTIIIPSGQSDWRGNIINVSSNSQNSGVSVDTDSDGYADDLYTVGNNYEGELGIGHTDNGNYASFVHSKKTWEDSYIIDISYGGNFLGIIVDSDNDSYADSFYGCGYNTYGQLGTDQYRGSKGGPKSLTKTFDRETFSSYYQYNFMTLESGVNSMGVLVDTNSDHYGDTIYMYGSNEYSIFGDGYINGTRYYFPVTILSSYDFLIQDLIFNFDGVFLLSIDLKLNDYQNIFDDQNLPIVFLTDNDNINYETTLIEESSNASIDQYSYQINDIEGAKDYIFKEISINDSMFSLNQEEFFTDYLISDYQISNVTEEEISIDLNFENNSDEFDLLNYSNDQRKIKINYTDLDKNISNSKEFVITENYEILLNNLNAETNYQIDSIQYFYEDGNYKHTINQEATKFQTTAATPLINSGSIKIINNSIKLNSFQYTIVIDNLKLNQDSSNFTQYDVNNGIWLIDEDGNFYHSIYLSAKIIASGSINGTGKYQLTFLQDQLIENTTYNFTGISFEEPSDPLDPNIITFSNPFSITTVAANKIINESTFLINTDSITHESFQYTVEIDNLFLIDDFLFMNENNQTEIGFSNFDLDEGLYLIDDNDNIYNSSYINNSSIYISDGSEEGTVNYQFGFEQDNLQSNSTYNFVGIGFTNQKDDFINFSSSIQITTNSNNSAKIIIWGIIIILVVVLLLVFILLFVDIKMKKNTKKMSAILDNPDSIE